MYQGDTLLGVRKLLAEKEKLEDLQGNMISENTSPTHWLAVGMELEDLR